MRTTTRIVRRRSRRKSQAIQVQQQQRALLWTIAVILIVFVILPSLGFIAFTGFIYSEATREFPEPSVTGSTSIANQPTQFLDDSGTQLLYAIQDPTRDQPEWVPLESLPDTTVESFLLTESSELLEGDDANIVEGVVELWAYIVGYSRPSIDTITDHVIENNILPQMPRTALDPYLQKLIISYELHQRYSPEEILEWYLNTAYFGNNAFGIEAASQVYYGKSAQEMSLGEGSLLAGIPPTPYVNPFDNPESARNRQTEILHQLVDTGFISQSAMDEVESTEVPLRVDYFQEPLVAPEFSHYARKQAEQILNSLGMNGPRMISDGGLKITTSLDLDLYAQTECIVTAYLAGIARQDIEANGTNANCDLSNLNLPDIDIAPLPPDEATLVILDVNTGEIKSWSGSAEAVTRQPGITLIPFIYFEGLRSTRYTPATMMLDVPQDFPGIVDGLIYQPSNPNDQYRGPVSVREALAGALLTPAVRVADNVGFDQIFRSARTIGLSSLQNQDPNILLLEHGGQVSVLDVAYAYSVFAAQGEMRGVASNRSGIRPRDPVAVVRIEDANGNVLWDYSSNPTETTRTDVLDPGIGYLINDMLSDRDARDRISGATGQFGLDYPMAIVDGTTSDLRDGWTLGYTPDLVVALHLGRGDGQSMSIADRETGISASVWQVIAEHALDYFRLPPNDWVRPETVSNVVVCELSGLLPNAPASCPTREEIFLEAVEPLQTDTFWEVLDVNQANGKIASADTPSELRQTQNFFRPPQAAMEWWLDNERPLPPTELDSPTANSVVELQFIQPVRFAFLGQDVPIEVEFNRDALASLDISYGLGIDPQDWFPITSIAAPINENRVTDLWDASALDGTVTLLAVASYVDGQSEVATRQITIDNVAPSIQLSAQEFINNGRNSISIQANVTDNLEVSDVEFYVNGQLLGIDREFPFGFELRSVQGDVVTIDAIASDAVGNKTQTSFQVDNPDP